MMKSFAALAVVTLAASFAVATPASAVTVLLGGPSGTADSVTRSADGVDFTFTATRFTGDPSLLSGLWSLGSPLSVSISAPGLGVAGGGAGTQIDTNQANRREALVLSASRPFEISGLKLSAADANDTLMLYGVNEDGSFVPLISSGTIRSGLDSAATVVNSNANGRTSRLTFDNPWGNFTQYVFTTRVPGNILYNGDRGQGYRLDSISFNIIPEPRMWAMLIAGFGFVGVAARRRRSFSVSA
ncbi:PEPxxWA-CTERM sorting domain-containing protein [Sandaracinobacter sp.]|uniref:PEPxxWA-CTERM sorting domain-containing protein n=1 Tax=Sandaracinobacter sp. TaxID=2487581 RepID=UPI0035AFACF0